MSSRQFRRHAPACLDAAIHRVFDSLAARPALHTAFLRLLTAARARSELLRELPPARRGHYAQLEALRNLAGHHRQFTGDPLAWTGAPGRHPLAIIDALARHLVGRYPTPRFLASAWFGGGGVREREHRHWYIEHSRGRRFRDLRLPIAMTRRIEHAFLHSPDHLEVDRALRRAEVIGLGGSPALADTVAATRLGRQFDHAPRWREVIAWLAARTDEVDLAWVEPIIDHIHAAATPLLLARRSFEAVRREVEADNLAAPPQALRRNLKTWPRSPWSEATFELHGAQWRLLELTSNAQLILEGRALRHCVATYTSRCVRGTSRIWSLRKLACEGPEISVLTIEVEPKSGTVVQVRGRNNRRATGAPLALLRQWIERERLRVSPTVAAGFPAEPRAQR